MDINMELYKVFYSVAKSLSFSEAAKELYISQSAVSQSIKLLERRLNQQLFIRSTKKVRLTTEGEILLQHVAPAIGLLHRGEQQLQEAAALNGGQIRIGASDTICRYFLVPYLQYFHKKYPNILIKVTNGTSFTCVDLLENSQVDLILVNAPNTKLNRIKEMEVVREFTDVFICNPKAFPQAIQAPLTLKQLQQFPILMLERNSTTSEFLYNLFLQQQLELIPSVELSSNDLLIDLARIGLGIAFVPDFCITPSQDLAILSVKTGLPKRKLMVSCGDQAPPSPAVVSFLEALKTPQEDLIS